MKYDYYVLKKSQNAIPEGVNEPIEQLIGRLFECVELNKELVDCRKEHLFGPVKHVNHKRRISCELNFVNGMIVDYKLTGAKATSVGDGIEKTRHIKNDVLTYTNKLKKE